MKEHLHELYEHKELLIFAGGIATAIIGKQLLKSETVKKTGTRAMAKVLETKKEAEERFQNMKDDAEDMVEDAERLKKEEIYVNEVEIDG
ncbi:MAG: hypothetical protein Q4P18_08045 [Methanobrevibacter sp.]|uniref:hypothetical protein n=1 Tax=Methanobrevibacter sp. TaxID=66852 RepID=UPI0026DFC0D3|nr:hypothetical protein [Methanobrevibacter sp.]MDO5849472.1 hypothetical protein [Methanobrevibacter sp.]